MTNCNVLGVPLWKDGQRLAAADSLEAITTGPERGALPERDFDEAEPHEAVDRCNDHLPRQPRFGYERDDRFRLPGHRPKKNFLNHAPTATLKLGNFQTALLGSLRPALTPGSISHGGRIVRRALLRFCWS